MVTDVRVVTSKSVGFKAFISDSTWLDQLFALIHQRGLDCAPDFISLGSSDGGTGSA